MLFRDEQARFSVWGATDSQSPTHFRAERACLSVRGATEYQSSTYFRAERALLSVRGVVPDAPANSTDACVMSDRGLSFVRQMPKGGMLKEQTDSGS